MLAIVQTDHTYVRGIELAYLEGDGRRVVIYFNSFATGTIALPLDARALQMTVHIAERSPLVVEQSL